MLSKKDFLKQSKVVKRYGNHTGRRFARVEIADEWFHDVRTREARGDSEITSVARIKAMAWNQYQIDNHVLITDAMIDDRLSFHAGRVNLDDLELFHSLVLAIRDKYEQEITGWRKTCGEFVRRLDECEALPEK